MSEQSSSSSGSTSTPDRDPSPERGQRSVGRGKGRSRGRGRGKGKAPARAGVDPNRADEALHIIEDRKERFRTQLKKMSKKRMGELLLGALENSPSLILDLHEPQVRKPGQGYHPPEGSDVPNWCVCGRCRDMPTAAERLCCKMNPDQCISRLPDFHVLILDEAVLALARLYRRDVLVVEDEGDLMRANRHAGYRQYVLWQCGRLGVGDRRVIPSCCVWRIRDKYPNAYGVYTGFTPSRLV